MLPRTRRRLRSKQLPPGATLKQDTPPEHIAPAGFFLSLTQSRYSRIMTDKSRSTGDPLWDAVLRGPGPTPTHLSGVALPFVERHKLKLRNFRVDMEDIQGAVVAAMKQGQVDAEDAKLIFFDTGNVVSLPLVKRYLAEREYELVARWMKTNLTYANPGWLTERNRLALEGMIQGDEPAMAVALLRKYLKVLYRKTQSKWRTAGAKTTKNMPSESLPGFEAQKAEALRELPAHLEIAEQEMAEIELYLADYGSREDNRALEKFRDEIARVRKRFDLKR